MRIPSRCDVQLTQWCCVEYEAEAWESGSRHSDETGYDTKSRSRSRAPSPRSFHNASQAGDYYRDTNLTTKTGSNPNLTGMAGSNMSHYGGQPTMSQYAIPQLPFMPFTSAASVHGSDYGGGMAMPGPIPYQPTGSVYAMSMMPPAMPMAPRNTVVGPMNMLQGDASGSQVGFTPPMAPGMQQRPISTFSMATSVNPFAGPSMNPNPSDEELVTALRNYLSTQDLMTVTKK